MKKSKLKPTPTHELKILKQALEEIRCLESGDLQINIAQRIAFNALNPTEPTPTEDNGIGSNLNLDKLEKEADNFIANSTKESYEQDFKGIEGVKEAADEKYPLLEDKYEVMPAIKRVFNAKQLEKRSAFIEGSNWQQGKETETAMELREENEKAYLLLHKAMLAVSSTNYESDRLDSIANEIDDFLQINPHDNFICKLAKEALKEKKI